MKSLRQILISMGLLGSQFAQSINALAAPRVRAASREPHHIQAWKIERAKAKRERKAARRQREIELVRKGLS